MKNGPYPNYLAELMRSNGLTDRALADKLGVSKQQIFNLRRWHRKLTVEWAKRLAPHLGVSWERLITGLPAPSDEARAQWLALYDALDEEQRRAILVVVGWMVRRDNPPATEPTTPHLSTVGTVAL